MKPTDIRIREVEFSWEDFRYRSPIKFGGVALDRVTMLDVRITVETRDGRTAEGIGSMPMGNIWAYPSRKLGYEETLGAMKAVVERVAADLRNCTEYGHPIDLAVLLEPGFHHAAEEISAARQLADPIPILATLVCASPFDAAVHDAFGVVHNRNCYSTYGPDLMSRDLGDYLGKEYRGEWLDRWIDSAPKPRMPLYHLVGALDPLTDADVKTRLGDGLPETLGEWITFNGLTHLKIKLNGDDLNWDVERVLGVDAVARPVQAGRGVESWFYSLDFNERCANVGYLLEFLARVKEKNPAAFERVQYIEQPTRRDLKADRANVMHEASKLRPVVIDESLIDLESLFVAREMGYTGAALKACKGQSQTMLLAAAARKAGMFLCVQDLTCPGASLIQSAGIAAHVPGVAAIESNSRQYRPAANDPWIPTFPGIFRVRDGMMDTRVLTGIGLGTRGPAR